MHILYCGPVSLSILGVDDLRGGTSYDFPLGAYLVEEYLKQGHRVTVVTSLFGLENEFRWTEGCLTVVGVPRRRHYLFCLDFYRSERRSIVRAICEASPDVIHAHWLYEFAHSSMMSGFPYLVTAHDSPRAILKYMPSPYRLFRYFYGNWMISRVKNVSAVSPYMRSELGEAGFNGNEVAIVPNGLQGHYFNRSKREESNFIRFVTISGRGRRKNVKRLILAYKLVRSQYFESCLVLIGPGLEAGGEIHKWAIENMLTEGIEFKGSMTHPKTLGYLSEHCDVFVHTSLEESFCMAVLEAMAQGLPIIGGLTSGAVPWLLNNGKAGLLADCNDVEAISSRMIEMAKNARLRKNLASAAYIRAKENFQLSKVAKKYLDLLSSIAVQ